MGLREKITEYLEFHIIEGDCPCDYHRANLKSMGNEVFDLAKEYLPELAKEAGYVKLAEDQSLPKIPEMFKAVKYYKSIYDSGWRAGYNWLKKNIKDWKKVEVEK